MNWMAQSWLWFEKICKARIRVASSIAVYWYRFTTVYVVILQMETTMSDLTIIHQSPLLNGVTDKDGRSRIGKFDVWLQTNGLSWHNPDLAAYRDSLLTNLVQVRGK
jgi:hypothetical protein